MDAIVDEYSFLPGLAFCCGDNNLFFGDIEGGSKRVEALVAAIAGFHPETVVLWSPTCHCRFNKIIWPALDVPFEILSFPQYLAENMNKLPLTRAAFGIVTLHETCKSAFIGGDRDGPRNVLRQLSGVTLKEMKHHGPDTVCCGSGSICWFPKSCAQIRKARLK